MFDSIGSLKPDAPQSGALDGVGKAIRQIWRVFIGVGDDRSSGQKNDDQDMVGCSSHCHGQTFGSNGGGTLTTRSLSSCSLRHLGGARGVDERIKTKRSASHNVLSQFEYLGSGENFVVDNIDKELPGNEAATEKLE